MIMEAHQPSGLSTPKIMEELPDEQLKSPNSASSPSLESCFALPNAPTNHLAAVDLSPAYDIFFYGHLLPIHRFPHLSISPCSSTNSLDSFTLPGTEFVQNQSQFTVVAEPIKPPKTKSITFFKRWRKCSETGNSEETEKKKTQIKFRCELSRLLKRYARLVRPLLIFSEGGGNKLKAQPISYSGNLSFRSKLEVRGRRGDYCSSSSSASPVNSGILLMTAKKVPSPVANSTMEELQSAIQELCNC